MIAARQARVSLCMIVRDEEHNLAECLAPVAGLFDEIVIVDTGSTDNTPAIAREFTPHVHEFAWCDDFAAARNESLRHATGDWIFWLDADDRVRPRDVAKLKELLDSLDERPQAFLMDTRLLPMATQDELSLVTHQRLFRRHPDVRWQGRVHEQLRPEFVTLGYECVFSDVEIDHVGYQEKSLIEQKARRKLRLLRMDFAVDPDNPSTLLHLGMALRWGRETKEARKHLMRLTQLHLGAAPCMRWVYDALASMTLNDGKPVEALEWIERGLAFFPGDENLLLEKAVAQYALADYDAAGCTLREIVRAPRSQHMRFGALGNVKNRLAPRLLGAVQRMQRAFDAAEETLQGVLKEFPDDSGSCYNLGLAYLDQGQATKLAPIIHKLLNLPDGQTAAGLLAALWHLRHGDLALARPIIDDLIAASPQLPRPRMLRAEWLSRSQAPMDAQIEALRDVLRIQPGNLEARHWMKEATRFQAASVQPAASPWPASVVTMPGMAVG